MLNKIIEFSIKNKLIIGLFVLALITFGIYETTRLPIDAVPDITNNQVQVITVAPSFGANDIERLITFPIEQATSNISGITEIRSFSRFGLSLVTIVFDDRTDVYWARQQVSERLLLVQSQIPPGIGTPELGPITTGLGEIYQYAVKPKKGYEGKYDETELRTIQDWIVRRQLLGVKGVAEVSSFGGKLKQFEIAVDPDRLKSVGLTLNEVFTAIEANNRNTGGAYIEKGPTALFIRTEGLFRSKEDIENVAIRLSGSGTPVLIRDVAKVTTGHATRYGAMCYNDEGEVAGAVVMMLKGGNSSEVIRNVKERIDQIRKTLPEGVEIEPFLDRTKMVNNAIGTVTTNLLEGALIVVFILVLFLGNLRAGFIVAAVIPLSMLFAIIMMNLFGVSGNLMSLGALDFGLIVDGAVIIVEAVMHRLRHSRTFASVNEISRDEMDQQVSSAAGKMMNSAVFGQIIILVVYLPIFSLQGIEGKMFRPMAQTVAFALIGAFLLSLTYVPMMSSFFLSRKINHRPDISDRIMGRIEKWFLPALQKILRIPRTIILTVSALFIVAMFILANMGGEFIPALEEGDFAVDTRVLTGSNLNTTIEFTQKAAGILKREFPEVEKVVTKIGSGEVPTDPMPMEAADMMVILKDKKEWTSAETFDELAEKMSDRLQDIPGITTGFQYPVQMRFNELMTGARQDVVCMIFGENLDSLAAYATQLGEIIKTVNGAEDLYIEPITGISQIVIEYNRPVIAQYGLNVDHINETVNMAFAGKKAGVVFEDERRFDMVVGVDHDLKTGLEDIRNLLIPIPSGNQIPLHQLAKVELRTGPNQIQRLDAKRRIVVGFNTVGRDVQSIVNELQKKQSAQIKFSPGYYITYGGSFENLKAAKDRLMIAVPVSLLLIFILLYFTFHSVKQGLLIYSAIPLSAIGGIYLLALRGMPFSISAGIGFIALFGVSVLNGIVLIAEFNRLRQSGITDLHEIVITGTRTRLRPVLMTALVASLGFLPMALSNSAGAEVQRPLATVVIGGLMLATFLTLFVLPVLYILFEKISHKPGKVATIIIALIMLAPSTSSATEITLRAAIDSAMKNNHTIRNRQLEAEYQNAIRQSVSILEPTQLSGEYGQINSIYNDNRISINQSIQFPSVYIKKRKYGEEQWRSALAAVDVSTAEIEKEVTEMFYRILILQEKEKLLLRADSLYREFGKKAATRLEKGETNVLERSSADAQRGEVWKQLASLQNELLLSVLEFRLMLNTTESFTPSAEKLLMEIPRSDTALNTSHPLLRFYEQEVSTARMGLKAEKAQRLPHLSVGYSNQTLRGIGADDRNYTSADRFTSIQVGLGLPLFAGQKGLIRSRLFEVRMKENELQFRKGVIKNRWTAAQERLEKQLELLNFYRSLTEESVIHQAATDQFNSGEINYLEWVMLTNQSIQVKNNYLDAIEKVNETIIEIQYLKRK